MKYKRVVLKISGETFSGKHKFGFLSEAIQHVAEEIKLVSQKCELAIVVGGGNIFRGSREGKALNLKRNVADYAGMQATTINGLILCDFLENQGIETRLMSALRNEQVAETYIWKRAVRHLEKGRVVVLAGGTGNPSVTTDMAMVIRAIELNAEVALKGTKVDGVFDKDPEKHPDAVLLTSVTRNEFSRLKLKILDPAAVSHAEENKIEICVFNIFEPKGNLKKAIAGESIGSLII